MGVGGLLNNKKRFKMNTGKVEKEKKILTHAQPHLGFPYMPSSKFFFTRRGMVWNNRSLREAP